MSRANPRFHRNNAPLANLAVNAVRATFFYLIDNQIALWTQDYTGTSTSYSGPTFEANMAAALVGALLATLRACLSSDCSITQVKVQSLTAPSRMPGFAAVATGSQPGTVAGTHLPSEMAAVISKSSAVKGQHGRGRLFLPGIPSGFVTPGTDANRLNATAVTAITSFLNALVGTTYTDGANTYGVGLTTHTQHGNAATQGQALVAYTLRALLGVIRRRKIGRGK